MAIMQTPLPIPDVPQAQAWLRDQQERLATAVGEPLFVTIRIVYDGFVEVDVETVEGRLGTAAGWVLDQALEEAVAMLQQLDEPPFLG
jgi:hypothetical protein